MWVLKSLLLLLLIHGIKSTKDSQFALDEYYQEASGIYEKANKIHLENELATGKIGALDVSERILNKKIDASLLEEYLEMKISGGLKEQNEMLELFEKAKESETSEQLKDDVVNGFSLMDGFSDLEKKISEFNIDGVEDYFKRLERRLYSEPFISEIVSQLERLRLTYSIILDYVQEYQDVTLSDTVKSILWKNIDFLRKISKASHDIPDALKQQGFNDDSQGFDSFERTRDVTEKLNAMMNEVKNMEGIDSKLLKVEKEMEALEELKEGNVVNEIKNRFQNLTKSSDFLTNFRTTTIFHGEYGGIQSISPLLQKIKLFSSKMRSFEFRTSISSKKWSTFENHFQHTNIQSGSLTEKFSNFRDCVRNFDFQMSFPVEFLADFDERLTQFRLVDSDIQNYTKRFEELAETTNNFLTLTERKYPDEAHVDIDFLPLFREFIDEQAWLLDVHFLEKSLRQIDYKIEELNLDNARKVFEGILEKMDNPKQFLECYSNLQTTASDIKELLVLPGKVWNFDPKVLESTVEVVGMFKEAYKMIEEIKEWKVATNPEIENFPLDGEDVKTVSDGINVLETIRNVQNGLEMMKTLDVENLEINDSWDLLVSSLSQFFEILSSQKIWNLSNVSFPTNLPIDTIKTFIEDEYQENQRNDILNFLKGIQILQTDFHEYPNKLEKMNEAIEKMKEWEGEKMNTVKTMVDCSEALSAVRPLRNWFLKESNYLAVKRPPGDKLTLLPQRFGELIRKLWNPRALRTHVSPHEMLQAVVVCSNKKFQFIKQNDAYDFMLFLLTTLHTALNGSEKRESIISKTFRGRMREYSRKVIPAEDTEEEKYRKMHLPDYQEKVSEKPFLFLTLDLPAAPLYRDVQLQNIIPQKEYRTYNDNIMKRYELLKLPEFLIISYKRFQKNQWFVEKNPTIVNFPIVNVDLYECLAEDVRRSTSIRRTIWWRMWVMRERSRRETIGFRLCIR
ncbi:hypothetical protein B9Z55_007174 [Caenorhabditis nigoni]|nr:hypothetical protein B9Z55_007174 [Caenorhabditis nigoni]